MEEKKKALKAAFPLTVPVMLGYLFLGIAFGVLLQKEGFHWGWALLMSAGVYAGSLQFVTIQFLTGGVSWVSMIFVTLSMNIRFVFYGLSMLERFRDTGKLKPYLIFSMSDETFSLACSEQPPNGIQKKWFYFFIALLNQLYWIAGSVLGGLAGEVLPFETKGIDFAMTALFVVIFVEQWKSASSHIPALAGLAGSAVCLLVLGLEKFILPAMMLVILILLFFRKPLDTGEDAA